MCVGSRWVNIGEPRRVQVTEVSKINALRLSVALVLNPLPPCWLPVVVLLNPLFAAEGKS